MDFTETFKRNINRYEGLIANVTVDVVEMPDGSEALREIVEHPGGVSILPVDDEGFAYCVRQFRYAVSGVILEAPAGKLEPGEIPEQCAIRELSEETGIAAAELIPLGPVYPSPGFCKEVLYLFLARGLTFGTAHPDEEEIVKVERIHINELYDMVCKNEILDAKTIISVIRAKLLLEGGGW